MRILGIDPGIAIVGWGAIDYTGNRFSVLGCGSITTPAKTPPEDRLLTIYDRLNEILDFYKPESAAAEELFWNTNQKTGIVVAEARGVIMLAIRRAGLAMNEYTPLQVKQAVVGYGRAEKKQVIAMVTSILGMREPPKPDDTADALAVAICHAHSGFSRLAGAYKTLR